MARWQGGENMVQEIAISEKHLLTVDEAIAYFNIGGNRLRLLPKEWPNAGFFLYNGNRLLFKRKKMEEFLDEQETI